MLFGRVSKWVAAGIVAVMILSGCGGAEERKGKYLERAKAYFEEENYDKAKIEFKNVLQIDPKTAAPYYFLGRIAEADQEWREAFGNYSKAVELDPDLLEARTRLGRFYLLADQSDKAEEQISEVLTKAPDDPDALLLRATILFRSGKPDEAIASSLFSCCV